MRSAVFATVILGFAIGPVFTGDPPQNSAGATAQLPATVVARLPAPQKPGDARRSYIAKQDKAGR